MRRRRSPEIIGGRVNADGTIAAGDGFTVLKGTAGLFTLTFAAGFRATGGSASTSRNGANTAADLYTTGSTAIVSTFTCSSGALVDYQFIFVVVGQP